MSSPNTEQTTVTEAPAEPRDTAAAFSTALETLAAQATQNWPMPAVYEPVYEGVPTLGV